jgi:hypothetical protein
MREDGRLIGYGTATVLQAYLRWSASTRGYRPCRGPGHVFRAEALIVPERSPRSCAGRSPAGAAARGEDPLEQGGHPCKCL